MLNLQTPLLKRRWPGRTLAAGAALAALAGALQLTSRPACATDSGLGFYPTADIYSDGNFHFDYDTYGQGLKTNLFTSHGLEYGFGKGGDGVFGRNEIGFDYLASGFINDKADKRLAFNYKTQLYNDDKSGTRLALGVANIGDKVNFPRGDVRLLGYKTFSFGRLHAGVWDGFGRGSGVKDTAGVQLGVDHTIGKFIVGADYRSGPTGFLAPCVIYNVNDKADFEVCVGRANSSSIVPRYQTYLAFDYNFDFKKK